MPYDKVILSWPKVAQRIDELIADGRYMSRGELDHLPVYEKEVLAERIMSFYHLREGIEPRIFPDDMEYRAALESIQTQLDEPERVTLMLDGMAAVLDNTASSDRHYETMRQAFDSLTEYQNGTFTLFPLAVQKAQTKESPSFRRFSRNFRSNSSRVRFRVKRGISASRSTTWVSSKEFISYSVVPR